MPTEQEPVRKSPEASAELHALAQERLEEIRTSPENGEKAQVDQLKEARESIEKHAEKPQARDNEHAEAPHKPSHLDPFINYKHTMSSLRQRLTPASRRISDFIHSPAIERTSEALERTVMRPSVTLGATSTALLVGTILYVMARHYGFPLSGSEILLAMLVGGIFGAITELLFKPFTRRRR